MPHHWLALLTLLTALSCGLVAGVFFAFSTFVMKALARLPAAQGMAAMQSINIAVMNPWFMGMLFGTAAGGTVLAAMSAATWHEPRSLHLIAGSVVYIVGTIGVTMVCNVPLNNALAGTNPASALASSFWEGYVSRWTAWNTVRTVAAIVAAAFFTIALM